MQRSSVLYERTGTDCTVRLAQYAGGVSMPQHAHDDHGISIVLDGALVEEARHQSVTATAGWTVVKPAGTIHANRFGPAGATLLAITPRVDPEASFSGHWRWLEHAAVFRAALRLVRDASDDSFIELIAALAPPAPGAARSPWLRRIRSILDDHSSETPTVATLAADAGVHPVYLARRFRGAFGVSLREYRQIAQVRRAIQLVVGSRRSLSDIAHSAGFADHSHMCRAFRNVAGTTPGALRAS